MKEKTPARSTLVLQALAELNEALRDDDAFAGYTDDSEGTERLLQELWLLDADTVDDLIYQWFATYIPEEFN